MDLEERSIETLPERCQSCGAKLTDAEKQVALESGARLVLCTRCASEQVPVSEDEIEESETGY
jgi:DNA-directed RNA polymerase subunit RPC12/RpoP